MRWVRVHNHPLGPRVWIAGQRVHHGAAGIILAVVGAALAAHDRHDWRHWFLVGEGPAD